MAPLAYKLFWLDDPLILSYDQLRRLSKERPHARYHWLVSCGEKERNIGILVATRIEVIVLKGATE